MVDIIKETSVEDAKSEDITSGIVLGCETLVSDDAVRAIFSMSAEDVIELTGEFRISCNFIFGGAASWGGSVF